MRKNKHLSKSYTICKYQFKMDHQSKCKTCNCSFLFFLEEKNRRKSLWLWVKQRFLRFNTKSMILVCQFYIYKAVFKIMNNGTCKMAEYKHPKSLLFIKAKRTVAKFSEFSLAYLSKQKKESANLKKGWSSQSEEQNKNITRNIEQNPDLWNITKQIKVHITGSQK